MSSLIGRLGRAGVARIATSSYGFNKVVRSQISNGNITRYAALLEMPSNTSARLADNQVENEASYQKSRNAGPMQKYQIGQNVSRKDKINFLLNTFHDLKDSKEAVYGALDAWVAWEHNFPIASLKRALIILEKEQQWHKVIQVIKWMLSKGQGNTMGTYGQLIQALDMDHRAEEAHMFWSKKIGTDFHSVPWQLCRLMLSVYYRNNMLERLIKLFKGLESFDRKPPEKSVVRKVADAYEMLGMLEEKERVLLKYNYLFNKIEKDRKKSRNNSSKKKPGLTKHTSNSGACTDGTE